MEENYKKYLKFVETVEYSDTDDITTHIGDEIFHEIMMVMLGEKVEDGDDIRNLSYEEFCYYMQHSGYFSKKYG